MWAYLHLRDVINENHFHNCVRDLVPVSRKELLRIMRVENYIEQHGKQYSYLIEN